MEELIANHPKAVANFLIVFSSILTGVFGTLFGIRIGPDKWLKVLAKTNDVVEAVSDVLDKIEEYAEGDGDGKNQ